MNLGPIIDFKIWGEKFAAKPRAELRRSNSLERWVPADFKDQTSFTCCLEAGRVSSGVERDSLFAGCYKKNKFFPRTYFHYHICFFSANYFENIKKIVLAKEKGESQYADKEQWEVSGGISYLARM